jgi:hypothetical protein
MGLSMKTASTRTVFEYWNDLRGERAAPDRGEIEPGEIKSALADAFILENTDGVLQFRLAGSRICALFGKELKGSALEDLWHEKALRQDLARLTVSVMDESAGSVAGLIAQTESGETLNLELLLLPLRHSGKTHSRMLGALAPATTPPWLGFDPITVIRLVSVRMMWPNGFLRRLANPEERRSQFVVIQGGASG